MKWAVVILAFAVVGCSPKTSTADKLAELNAQDALDRINALSARVDELEQAMADEADDRVQAELNLRNDLASEIAEREAGDANLNLEIQNLRYQ